MALELRDVAARALKDGIYLEWRQFLSELSKRERTDAVTQFLPLIADLHKWRIDALNSTHAELVSSVDSILVATRSILSARRDSLPFLLKSDAASSPSRKRRKLDAVQLDKNTENDHFIVPTSAFIKKSQLSSPRPPAEDDMRSLDEQLNRIDRSEIKLHESDVLGTGGFSTVCRGLFRGCPVAVKRVRNSVRDEDFYKELRNISTLRHPNIVQYMAHFRNGAERCIVTEWAERGSLFNLLHSDDKGPSGRSKKRKLKWSRKVKMARDVAAALRFMHESNYRHCDVSSKNLLVTREYRVKVADFGLSEEVHDDMASQVEDRRIGTLRWMSPEMLAKSCKSMEKADVTERIPYFDKLDDEVRRLIQKHVPPAVPDTSCWRECTRFRDLMNRCLHQQPNLRPDFHAIHTELVSIEKELAKEHNTKDISDSGQTSDESDEE